MRNPAFLFFAGTPVHNQDSLALFCASSQRQRSAVSVYRKHARELIEKFPEHVLPQNMYAHRQCEPLASAAFSACPNLLIHTIPNLGVRLFKL